jgi:hypothetical protein
MDDALILVSPAYVLGFCIASIYGLLFFLFFGQGWQKLFLFWGTAVIGFFIGQAIAKAIGLALFNIGAVNVVEGTLGSALGLIAARAWRG